MGSFAAGGTGVAEGGNGAETVDLFLRGNVSKCPVSEPGDLATLAKMKDIVEKTLALQSSADVESAKDAWLKATKAAKEFEMSLKKGLADLRGHVKAMERQKERTQKLEEKKNARGGTSSTESRRARSHDIVKAFQGPRSVPNFQARPW